MLGKPGVMLVEMDEGRDHRSRWNKLRAISTLPVDESEKGFLPSMYVSLG